MSEPKEMSEFEVHVLGLLQSIDARLKTIEGAAQHFQGMSEREIARMRQQYRDSR